MSHSEQQEVNPKKKSLFLRFIQYILLVLGISFILSLSIVLLSNDLFAFVKPDEEITVTIPNNASVGDVSKVLDENDVINYRLFFQVFVMFSTRDVQFKPGEYDLNPSMDYRELLSTIRYYSNDSAAIFVPAGSTVEEIRQIVLDSGLSSEEDWNSALKAENFNSKYLPSDISDPSKRLEGHLLPATYEFDLDASAETIINTMLERFDEKITSDAKRKSIVSVCKKKGISVQEAVIIASIVQKEAVSNEEMKGIAGVIYNRLNHPEQFPTMQLASTLEYCCGHEAPFSDEEKKTNSPYNTYVNKGLPVGAIGSPSYAALYAAVHPSDHGYYYYSLNEDGTAHDFSATQQSDTQ